MTEALDTSPLPDLDAPELSETARASVRSWLKAVRSERKVIEMLDVIRIHVPEAFNWLMLNHTGASRIAIDRDWLRPAFRSRPDDDEVAAVRAAVATVEAPQRRPGAEPPRATQPAPPPSRAYLEWLLEKWRREATVENGGFQRIAMIEAQLAEMVAAQDRGR